MNSKRVEFGKWLQEKREAAGLSQNGLAKKLSLTKSTIAHWENGLAAVPIERLFDLAELYGLDMKEVIEKLELNEPGIMDRFNGLALRFAKYHLDLMTNRRPGEIRNHHRGVNNNIYYRKSDLERIKTFLNRLLAFKGPGYVTI